VICSVFGICKEGCCAVARFTNLMLFLSNDSVSNP
jgi:hypothetical protein